MRIDHDDDPAIAAWDAYSAAHKGYVEAHRDPDVRAPLADGGAEEPSPGRRAEDPALSRTIDGTVETIGADQASGQNVRQPDG
jgi:hypothetical protein